MAAPAIAAFGAAVSKVASATAHATNSISTLGRALTQQLAAPITVVQGLIGQVSSFVEKANPGAIFHLNRAMDNMIAVIGQGLTPVVQGVTGYLKTWGDTLAQMMPIVQPVFDELGQMLVNVAYGGTQVVKAMAPFIELIADALVRGLQEASRAIAFFQGVVTELITAVAKLFGLTGSRMATDRSAKGAAVYQPQVSGVEEFARKQFEQSLMGINQNRGGGKKPEDWLQEISGKFEEGRLLVDKILIEATEIKNNIVNFLANASRTAEAVGDAFGKPGGVPAALAGWLGKIQIS
jgi:hypothetical protein